MKIRGLFSKAGGVALFSATLLTVSAVAQEGGFNANSALKESLFALDGENGADNAADSAAAKEGSTDLSRGRRESLTKDNDEAQARQPTEITASQETTFDEKTRKVVFVGTVVVKDPEFHLTCDRLTVFLRKEGSASGDAPSDSEGALDRVIAEGKVVIVQEKPDEKGKITRYVGKAAKAEYNGVTGDMTLSGWPQIQQGINNQVATEEGTVMILNRNGRMQTRGASKTVIAESSEAPKQRASGGGRRPMGAGR